MAARLLKVRRRFPVVFFVLFTWNVEFRQTFAFSFVSHKQTSIFGQIFLARKRWVHNTASSTEDIPLALKNIKPRILRPFERSFSKKKNGKNTDLTYYPLVRRWILNCPRKRPRPLSVYTYIKERHYSSWHVCDRLVCHSSHYSHFVLDHTFSAAYCWSLSGDVGHACVNIKYNLIKLSFRS